MFTSIHRKYIPIVKDLFNLDGFRAKLIALLNESERKESDFTKFKKECTDDKMQKGVFLDKAKILFVLEVYSEFLTGKRHLRDIDAEVVKYFKEFFKIDDIDYKIKPK